MTDHTFDLVILGGGSGGYAAALRAAELGRTVALIEKDKVGGTCLHRGCIPTKALLHAAEVADQTRDAAAVGIRATFDGIDIAGVRTYREGIVAKKYKGLEGLVKARGITATSGRHVRLCEGEMVNHQATTQANNIRNASVRRGHLAPPREFVERGDRLRTEERGRDQIGVLEQFEAVLCEGGVQDDAGVEDQHAIARIGRTGSRRRRPGSARRTATGARPPEAGGHRGRGTSGGLPRRSGAACPRDAPAAGPPGSSDGPSRGCGAPSARPGAR